MRRRSAQLATISLALLVLSACAPGATRSPAAPTAAFSSPRAAHTAATPITHLVVIVQENVSFDHYFATYPIATNPPGEPRFVAAPGTPAVDGLDSTLLSPNNPNSVQPFRLDRGQAHTCDQNHGYAAEQTAFNNGGMDRFVEAVGRGGGACPDYGKGAGIVMGYYDGNTVTALWNYAQHFAMSDRYFATTFGPSTPGALNLISGQSSGFEKTSPGVTSSGTVTGDPQPIGDACDSRDRTRSSDPAHVNVGDLLNRSGVSWGWFHGGFAECAARHSNVSGIASNDYVPHHEPFQYYATTANPNHDAPASVAEIGHSGPANHQYDLTDLWASLDAGELPAVSFVKAPAYQDGHAGYSTPLDEQRFLVSTLNRLQASPEWAHTAVIITYDDSDGWYDHASAVLNNRPADRAGFGPRLPLLLISPYAKPNFVSHTALDQTSVLSFIQHNWLTGGIGSGSFDAGAGSLLDLFDFSSLPRPQLTLDPATGELAVP